MSYTKCNSGMCAPMAASPSAISPLLSSYCYNIISTALNVLFITSIFSSLTIIQSSLFLLLVHSKGKTLIYGIYTIII